ncbi:CRISPR-associated protein Cas5 [Sphingomonas sp. TZW2008]|uniref:CRISPR-associated protein Cas5 n=1 Tax=Sphingomonas sp. TZW2008 TaxID=1917973 RepID=UPI001181C673
MNEPRATSVRIELRGMHACFRRPEFVDDLISYDVISPRQRSAFYRPSARVRIRSGAFAASGYSVPSRSNG